MRDFLQSTGRWLRVGWIVPLALLALPMCSLNSEGAPPCIPNVNCPDPDEPEDEFFEPGDPPLDGAILCDIPKFNGMGCASDDDIDNFPAMSGAALVLNLGGTLGSTVLDYSDTATAACMSRPMRVEFLGPFPEGTVVCLNCLTQIPDVYSTFDKACIAKCKEENDAGGEFPAAEVANFCAENARVSTNFDPNGDCYDGFCTMGGSPIDNPPDPRRAPEDVGWVDLRGGAILLGDSVVFPGPDPMTGLFSAGAASVQLITTGDAWVEFGAGETGVSHVIGVRDSCDDIADCPDEDGTIADLPLVLSLNSNGDVNVVENGTTVISGPHAPDYGQNERFRIYVKDLHNDTAQISFTRLTGPCDPNMDCDEVPLYTYTGTTQFHYPLRVDVSFREPHASLNNVTIMRIIK